jgi:ribosome-associated protein
MAKTNPNINLSLDKIGTRTARRPARSHEVQDPTPQVAAARRDEQRLTRALENARHAAKIAADNRGKEVLLLDMRELTPLVDYFVIVSTVSRRQAQSAASEIDAELKKIGEKKLGMEGYEEGRWVLIDYGDFVVHILAEEARSYYSLEDLWGDAPRLDWKTGEPISTPPPSA